MATREDINMAIDILPFVDVASAQSLEAFRPTDRIARWLSSFRLADVELATLVGSDRRVTRLISQWVFEEADDDGYLYGGIRYLSRLGAEYECWALFEGISIAELERRPALRTDADLCRVAARYGLTIH